MSTKAVLLDPRYLDKASRKRQVSIGLQICNLAPVLTAGDLQALSAFPLLSLGQLIAHHETGSASCRVPGLLGKAARLGGVSLRTLVLVLADSVELLQSTMSSCGAFAAGAYRSHTRPRARAQNWNQ